MTQKEMIEEIYKAIHDKKGLLVRVANLELQWKILIGILVIGLPIIITVF